MTNDRLGGEDSAWLHMEDATNPMVVNGMLALVERLPVERALAVLGRLRDLPRFRSRVVERAVQLGPPSWEPVLDFDLAAHVEHCVLRDGGEDALRTFIGATVSVPLDRDRPLWRVHLIDRPGAGTTILFRVHHAIGDGFALLDVLRLLCDGAGVRRLTAPPRPRVGRTRGVISSARAMRRLIAVPHDTRTVLKGTLQTEKHVAWSDRVALEEVKVVARAVSATVNDVLVAVCAGALRRYLQGHGEAVDGIEIHAMVPVNLRPSSAPQTITLGNRFGLVILGLPVGVAEPLARISAVKDRMATLKATPEATVAHRLLQVMGWAPRPLESLAASFFGKKASLVLTNVPGPRGVLTIDGIAIDRVVFWVPEAARLGLGISIFSYAGAVTVGILADAKRVPDPAVIVAGLDAELAALREEIRTRPCA